MLEKLAAIVGASGILSSAADMAPFVEDWRGLSQGEALCVVLPATPEQAAEVVRLCARTGTPVLPQGGNTSLCGGAVPPSGGPRPVIVGLQRLRRIRAIDPVNDTITVDAGCVLATVQATAAEHGRLYAVSLGAEGSCQVGGTIATNAGGTGVLRYGNTRDNVLGLEVVLPDGTIWDGLTALRKNNTGYDLKHLFIGSEGTLGLITGAVLKLHPLPTARSVAWLSVAEPQAAIEALSLFRASCGSRLSAFEMINDSQAALVVKHVPGRRIPVTGGGWHVLVELADTGNEASLDAAMQAVLEDALDRGLVTDAVVGASEAQREALWAVRHGVSEANKKEGVSLTSDTAVPISAVPAFIASATAAVRAIIPGLTVLVVAHLGDGNVHFIPFFSFAAWEVLAEREAIVQRIRHAVDDAAMALGGTFSAEHGVGATHLPEMARYKPPVELAMMRAIKQAFDPSDLFNSGRLLPLRATAPTSASHS
ncbi:FAD-binding oxidoreductase [Methylobacterium nodulans]|uniref:FAD linked oxidase domain protein n=1 Tax=Methylobacterium nodulans (strain LMG 21967 / CNCM I-2342 / ORS 2060) TaxID=460265 RepID=B8IW07_METNO|nr:FAD-binding oxidoreductase [Methylobacterium nodulans]ACL62597.1 FAD linked oxidase domain protein [Methylobacterium nodulans ORS 2060]